MRLASKIVREWNVHLEIFSRPQAKKILGNICFSEQILWNSESKPRGLYFSKALFEGLIFGGAYLWREICVSKLIGLALQLEGNLLFLLCFTLYLRAISKYKPPGGLYLEGRFNWGFFALRVWGTYTWRGLFWEFYGILQKTVVAQSLGAR